MFSITFYLTLQATFAWNLNFPVKFEFPYGPI